MTMPTPPAQPTQPDSLNRAMEVQDKYRNLLLALPNVIGVGIGRVIRAGEELDEIGVIVMVDTKLPQDQLQAQALIPREIEGVPVDVQAMGGFTAF
jgi:hypothetical protein